MAYRTRSGTGAGTNGRAFRRRYSSIAANACGIVSKIIPANRCAHARDIGSRYDNQAAAYLANVWLPSSGEAPGDFPIIFHYVNVGPNVRPEDMITDVYLPLR